VFFRAEDYTLYLHALREAANNNQCQVHAYVLMTNHVHLLVTPERKRSLPLMMQAMGITGPLLTPHPLYLGLDIDPAARQNAYRRLFRDTISEAQLTRLRDSTNACTLIGNDRFKDQIATMLGRAVPTGRRGRPKTSA